MRKNLLMAALLGLPATQAAGQHLGTLELGGFVRYNRFDHSFRVSESDGNRWGGGARAGFFLSRHWQVELDASKNYSDVNYFTGFESTSLRYYPWHLRIVYNLRFGENGPLFWMIGAGPALNRYGIELATEPGFEGHDWGGGLSTGFRFLLTNWLALRLDGTLDYVPSPNNGRRALVEQFQGIRAASPPDNNLNLGAQAGLSLMFGMCDKRNEGTTIAPTVANVAPGGMVNFTASATHCGQPDQVVYTVSGPGNVSTTGIYTASGSGNATITACGRRNRICATAEVAIVSTPAPQPMAPPPPPIRTLVRCVVTPERVVVRIDQPVTLTVTCTYSDGTSQAVEIAGLVAPGADIAGAAISFSTPGVRNVTVNLAGQPALVAMIDVQQIKLTVSDSAFFEFDKTEVYRPQDQRSLNEVADILKAHPEIRLAIDGHTDSDGSVAYNAVLGLRRAEAVRSYFASRGVPVERMTLVLRSFGECVPVMPNATAAGRALNRRAELLEFGRTPPGEGNAVCAEAGRGRKP